MKVTTKLMSSQKPLVSVKIANVLEQITYSIFNAATKLGKEKLQKTLHYATPRSERLKYGQTGFGGAFVALQENSVDTKKYGADAHFRIVVLDKNTGAPHKIWHDVSGGTTGEVMTRLKRIPIRKSNRTSPRNLQARPFDGFTGEWRTLSKGRKIKGTQARQWYDTAAEELKRELRVIGFTNKQINELLIIKYKANEG